MNTPIYHKTSDDMPWPKDKFFYILAREGLFKCRNHEFFESCVKVDGGLKDLASQEKFLRLSYPKVPQVLLERAVGFFQLVVDKQNSESAVILAWNRTTEEMELVIPDQIGINSAPSQWNPKGYPMDVKYEIPPLNPNLALIGDIHCHVDGSAYASFTDEKDETYRAGIHIVVGRIEKEPPEFHCEAVADGKRFKVDKMDMVVEGYHKRRTKEVPPDWLDRVKLEEKKYGYGYASSGSYNYQDTTGYGSSYPMGCQTYETSYNEQEAKDREIMKEILSEFSKRPTCPECKELSDTLWRRTKQTTCKQCEDKAKKFIKAWPKIKKNQNEKQAA